MKQLLDLTLVLLCWGHFPSFCNSSHNFQPQHAWPPLGNPCGGFCEVEFSYPMLLVDVLKGHVFADTSSRICGSPCSPFIGSNLPSCITLGQS